MADRATRMSPEPLGKIAGSLTGSDAASVRKRIVAMEHLLEGLFTIPGTNRKVGLDVILDVIPIGGGAVAALMGAWMAWEARNLGMSKSQVARMAGNIGVDFLLGLIPGSARCPISSSGRTPATCASSSAISTSTTPRRR